MDFKRITFLPRERRLPFLLPILALPFLTLAFWALGGGSNSGESIEHPKGLSTELPEATLAEKTKDKLSLYEQAQRDSLQESSRLGQDLLSRLGFDAGTSTDTMGLSTSYPGQGEAGSPSLQEQKILRQLEELEQEINRTPTTPSFSRSAVTFSSRAPSPERTEGDLQRFEQLLSAKTQGPGEDPEIRQLEGMLEKILDIQHPDRVKQRLQEQRDSRPQPYTQLFPLRDSLGTPEGNAIAAVIHADGEVVSGAMGKLRLTEDILLNGYPVPRNGFLYGICRLEGERLKVRVSSIRQGDSLLPVSLSAFDLDGQEGLFVPGILSQDIVREGAGNASQDLQLMTLDPSLAAQAAEAGFQTVKSLFQRKQRLVKVRLKAGYRLLLKNTSRSH